MIEMGDRQWKYHIRMFDVGEDYKKIEEIFNSTDKFRVLSKQIHCTPKGEIFCVLEYLEDAGEIKENLSAEEQKQIEMLKNLPKQERDIVKELEELKKQNELAGLLLNDAITFGKGQ